MNTSHLSPGTLCITVGGHGENSGRVVRVISRIGATDFGSRRHGPAIVEGYFVETASGHPFALVELGDPQKPDEDTTLVPGSVTCIIDRRNLRPLESERTDEQHHLDVKIPVQS